MEDQLSFWEEEALPPHIPPVWTALDPEQRAEVVSVLARLIEKIAIAPAKINATNQQEKTDE